MNFHVFFDVVPFLKRLCTIVAYVTSGGIFRIGLFDLLIKFI